MADLLLSQAIGEVPLFRVETLPFLVRSPDELLMLHKYLRPKMDADSDSLFESLKAGYREGIPDPYSDKDIAAATAAFALMREVDPASVAGLETLPAGTFWPVGAP